MPTQWLPVERFRVKDENGNVRCDTNNIARARASRQLHGTKIEQLWQAVSASSYILGQEWRDYV